jgi:hypothetical protein
LEHLESIRRAIHDYTVTGIRPLAEALSFTWTTVAVAHTTSNEPKPVLTKVREFLNDSMLVINYWKLVHPLLAVGYSYAPQIIEGYEKIRHLLP